MADQGDVDLPTFVTIEAPKNRYGSYERRLDLDRDSLWPSSCFTHRGYKLRLELRSTNIPRFTRPRLFIKVVAISQSSDVQRQRRLCDGEITIKFDHKDGESFTTDFSIREAVDVNALSNQSEGWVELPENVIPYIGEQQSVGQARIATQFEEEEGPTQPCVMRLVPYITSDIPHHKLRIKIEQISIN